MDIGGNIFEDKLLLLIKGWTTGTDAGAVEVTEMDREGSIIERLVEKLRKDEDVIDLNERAKPKLIYHPFQNSYSSDPYIKNTMKDISVCIASKQ